MKKNFFKTLMVSSLILAFSTPVFAAIGDNGWYDTTITLPRTGAWTTVTRHATDSNQDTQVKDNKYDVLGRIIGDNGLPLSSYSTHKAKKGTIISHDTSTKIDDNIKAQFKTSSTNYFTTTADLGWRP